MADYITTSEYASLRGLKIETVRGRVKRNQIPFIKVGNSIMIDKSTPWEERKKTGRKSKEDKIREEVESRMNGNELKVKITRAYYISVEDASGKEICSDFTFGTKAEADKLGAKLKAEVERNKQ